MAAVAAAAGAAAIEVGVQGLKANPGGLNTYGFLRLLRRRLYNTAVPVSGVYAVAIVIAALSGGISIPTLNPCCWVFRVQWSCLSALSKQQLG